MEFASGLIALPFYSFKQQQIVCQKEKIKSNVVLLSNFGIDGKSSIEMLDILPWDTLWYECLSFDFNVKTVCYWGWHMLMPYRWRGARAFDHANILIGHLGKVKGRRLLYTLIYKKPVRTFTLVKAY